MGGKERSKQTIKTGAYSVLEVCKREGLHLCRAQVLFLVVSTNDVRQLNLMTAEGAF